MDFGTYIREARLRLQEEDRRTYSLRQVAERVGIEPSYLSKIERGIFPPPSEETIVLIAQELHEDKDVLLAMASYPATSRPLLPPGQSFSPRFSGR